MSTYGNEIINAVTVSAGTRRKLEKGHGLQRAFSVLLFSVFVVVDLLALVAGTSSFGSITRMQHANDQVIMTLGPVTSTVRANDVSGGVAVADEGPEGRALVLVQRDDVTGETYETRIYLYEGSIVQEYALGGSPYTPDRATALARSETFDFAYSDGVLTVTTDAGVAKVALRNLQGGA
ncbi:MAG: DUF4860 domain-containing protein [Atopobiaceae bacterium]|nr:DUF4860 domain-containing protein [Atopobiaceae bacterium]